MTRLNSEEQNFECNFTFINQTRKDRVEVFGFILSPSHQPELVSPVLSGWLFDLVSKFSSLVPYVVRIIFA